MPVMNNMPPEIATAISREKFYLPRSSFKWWLLGLVLLVGVINFWAMPYYFYAGDAYAEKINAIYWVRSGQITIPLTMHHDPSIKSLSRVKYRYFVLNKDQSGMISKWGPSVVALMALPELVRSVVFKSDMAWDAPLKPDRASILAHNIFNVVLSMVLAGYLFFLAVKVSSKAFPQGKENGVSVYLTSVAFTLAALYSSFVWNYLRAQSYDLWQLVFFTMGVTHYFLFKDMLRKNLHGRGWFYGHLGLALIFLSLLVLIKEVYLIILLAVGFDLFWPNKAGRRLVYVGLVGIFLVVLWAALNYATYGAVFLGNLRISASPDEAIACWGWQYILPRFYDYFLSPSKSIWVNFPLSILAILGIRGAWLAFKDQTRFILLVGGLITIILLNFYGTGERCYGPRFYLFILPIFSLASIFGLAVIASWKVYLKWPLWIMLGLFFCYNTYLQTFVNRHHYFLNYALEDYYEQMNFGTAYFTHHALPVVMHDTYNLIYHPLRFNSLANLILDKEIAWPEKEKHFKVIKELYEAYAINYFWAKQPREPKL